MGWRRHLFHTSTRTRTTWTLRFAVLGVLILAVVATRGVWTAWIGRSLVCTENLAASDLILVENFDPNYLAFERAAALQAAGIAPKVLVPVKASRTPGVPNPVSKGIAEVMARQARLATWEVFPIEETEPVTLNAAAQFGEYLTRERIRSVIVVTEGFRSRRSTLAYQTVLGPAGIQVRCVPVFGSNTPGTWTQSWHGVQEVVEQLGKLQYYRFYVVPVLARARFAVDPLTSRPGAPRAARLPGASWGAARLS